MHQIIESSEDIGNTNLQISPSTSRTFRHLCISYMTDMKVVVLTLRKLLSLVCESFASNQARSILCIKLSHVCPLFVASMSRLEFELPSLM